MATHLSRDRATAWLFEQLPMRVPTWLAEQRWYGSKAHTISGVEVEDVFWLPAGDAPVALLILRVTVATGGPGQVHRYATLVRCGGQAVMPSVIGTVDGEAVADAATEPSSLAALLTGLVSGATTHGLRGGVLHFGDATPRVKRLLHPPAASVLTAVPVGVEQSNTSVRLGTTHVFKLFRRLEAGEHPQLEIGRFLARAGFRGVPPLEGSITYAGADGGWFAIGAVEGWIENSGDGWHDALACLDRWCRDDGQTDELTSRLAALGSSLAAFHQAMASTDPSAEFAPEAVTPDDLRSWQAAQRTQLARTLALVDRHVDRWEGPAASLARGVLASRGELTASVARLGSRLSLGWSKLRIHGDFHLGQTLRTRDGYVVIDFEGEPSKPIAERRQKHSPLKDVAGMLRSIEYAVATVKVGGTCSTGGPDTARLRRTFIDAYRAQAAAGAPYLPKTLAAFRSWLLFFEVDKALYEVEYEANSRPTWVHIPLAAVVALMPSPAGRFRIDS